MSCVIETGGKQYLVKSGDILKVEKLAIDLGAEVEIPIVADLQKDVESIRGSFAKAKILDHIRGDKLIVFKKKRRKGYKRKNGHRQDLSVIQITSA